MNKKSELSARSADVATLWNRHFIAVLVVGFLSSMADQMVMPLLSKYAISLGAPLALAGSIVGITSGISLFMGPISGMVSDMFNRKFIMFGSVLTTCIVYAGYLTFDSIPALIFFRIIQGFSGSLMGIARTALATEYMPDEKVGQGVVTLTFSYLLATAIGPAIGLWVNDNWGYNGSFIAAITFAAIAAFVLFSLPYEKKTNAKGRRKLQLSNLIAIEIIPYSVVYCLADLISPMGSAFVALIGEERNISGVAMFFTVYSLLTLVLRTPTGKLLDKVGFLKLLIPAFFFSSLTFILLGVAQCTEAIVAASICKALSQGVIVPSMQAIAVKRIGKEHSGVALSTLNIFNNITGLTAPTIGGSIAQNFGYGTMCYVFAAVVLLGIPIYLMIERHEKQSSAIRT